MNGGLHEFVKTSLYVRFQDLELPSIMASLDICDDHDATNAPSSAQDHKQIFYNLRARQSTSESDRKRRCQLKPSKMSSNYSDCYMNKFKHKPTSKLLETIYEEPVALKNGRIKHMGGGKQRKVQFSDITKAKIKLRRVKKTRCRDNTSSSSSRGWMQKRKLGENLDENMDEFVTRFHELMGPKEANETQLTDSSIDTASSLS